MPCHANGRGINRPTYPSAPPTLPEANVAYKAAPRRCTCIGNKPRQDTVSQTGTYTLQAAGTVTSCHMEPSHWIKTAI
ncbi:hypothetical protein H072_3718 [Dactylellina haptotyla CBS 200.50]|uniref:Uncharacterized protein n=1 Tax=Dactylellina haptotyla (strain CBS 200.50) TaxID=1284197 RepID=S8BS74_DACHA|nr:hypothetical protein H072_3718 [Dactylellina haptotyla CBS 200.50]